MFQRIVTMADQLNNTQEANIKEMFSLFDVDSSGSISTHELDAAMRCLGKMPTEEDHREVDDGNGNVTEAKFLTLMKRKLNEEETEEEIQEAFQIFDKEGYGILSAVDLRQAMTHPGSDMSEREANAILEDAEIDKDGGQVDYKDLAHLASSQ